MKGKTGNKTPPKKPNSPKEEENSKVKRIIYDLVT